MKRTLIICAIVSLLGIITFANPSPFTQPEDRFNGKVSMFLANKRLEVEKFHQKINNDCESQAKQYRSLRDEESAKQVMQVPDILKIPVGKRPTCAIEFKGHHYLAVIRRCSWNEAKRYCEEMGGHLATPESVDKIDGIFRDIGECQLWMGFYKDKNKWFSITGIEVDKSMWFPGEPRTDGNYAEIYKGRLNDTPSSNGFICEWDN